MIHFTNKKTKPNFVVNKNLDHYQPKNIKIDKVTVWDNGGNGEDGKSSTANFLSGMYKSVPPLQEMFNMAGMDLPEYLKGKDKKEIEASDAEIDKPDVS